MTGLGRGADANAAITQCVKASGAVTIGFSSADATPACLNFVCSQSVTFPQRCSHPVSALEKW
eukprot:2252789-Amphidinium_carterae.2